MFSDDDDDCGELESFRKNNPVCAALVLDSMLGPATDCDDDEDDMNEKDRT